MLRAALASLLATTAGCATADNRTLPIEKALAKVAKRTGTQSLTVGPISDRLHMFRMV
jgi:hypothetical protein